MNLKGRVMTRCYPCLFIYSVNHCQTKSECSSCCQPHFWVLLFRFSCLQFQLVKDRWCHPDLSKLMNHLTTALKKNLSESCICNYYSLAVISLLLLKVSCLSQGILRNFWEGYELAGEKADAWFLILPCRQLEDNSQHICILFVIKLHY